MIVGCSGSGKSTLARTMQEISGLPLIHLDQQYWSAGWVEMSKTSWEKEMARLVQRDQWIMDGNYGSTMDHRLRQADMVVFLNRSALLCLSRVVKRTLTYYGKSRPDMPEGCPERFSAQFFHYVLTYNWTRRPGILRRLNQLKPEQEAVILRSDREVKQFLKRLRLAFSNAEGRTPNS